MAEASDPLIEGEFHSMSFLEHLEELRGRLFKVVIGLFAGTIISFFVSDYILEALLIPAKNLEQPLDLQVLQVQGMFMIKLQIAFMAGLVLTIPLIVHQIWGFVSPGLYSHEKKYFPYIMFATTFLFLVGLSFAYYLFIPLAISFLTSIGPSYIKFNVSINSYVSFLLRLCLLMGAIFEMPLLALLLGRLGLISSEWLRKYRRHSIVVIFILAAIFTPPDILTQVFMAVPLVLLYELSIFIVKGVEKRKKIREMEEDETD